MNKENVLKFSKGLFIIIVVMMFCFGLRAHGTDLSIIPDEIQDNYRDADGLPYFSEMDSYLNLRLTQSYLDNGFFGDVNDSGVTKDLHRNAPDGANTTGTRPMLSWVTIGLYNIINMFQFMSLKEVAIYTGALISVLAVIPAYTLARRVTNDYGAFVAAILVCLGPNYFSHTFAGFFDTDMFNVFFPLFAFLFFTESVRSDNIVKRVIFAILTVVTLLLFSLAWDGWYYYAILLVLTAIFYYLMGFLLKFHSIRSFKDYDNKLSWFLDQKMLCSIIVILILGIGGLTLSGGPTAVIDLISGSFGLLGLQGSSDVGSAATMYAFPNVLVSVAEMQVPNLLSGGLNGAFLASSASVINGIGGIIALFGALVVFALYTHKLWTLRPSKDMEIRPGKKSKVNRKVASQRKDEGSRFNLAIKELTSMKLLEDQTKDRKLTLLYYSVFFVWIGVSIVAASQGTRFIQVLLVPFGIVDGIFVGWAVDYVKTKVDNDRILVIISILCSFLIAYPISAQIDFIMGVILFVVLVFISLIIIYGGKFFRESNLSVKKTIAVLLITLALISPTVCSAYQTSEQVVPGTSDPMWNSMEYLKTDANGTIPNDTVIQSWWDFGYLFEIAADKQTYFDGGSQSGEGAFWTGRALTTSNLKLSKGIFTMLATTGTRATSQLNEYTDGNNSLSVDILLDTLDLSRNEAKEVMMDDYGLSSQEADNVLKYSHPDNPRETVVVLSSDMLQKAGWWSYFGTWNFEGENSTSRQYMVPTEVANITPNHTGYIPLLSENGITFRAAIHRGANGTNQTTAQVQAVFDNNNSTVMIDGVEYNPLKASNIMVIENNYLVKNTTLSDGKDGNYTLFILGDGDIYNVILIDNKLIDSMFTKLFLLGGNGQDDYELVRMDSGVSLWKVNLDSSSNTTS